MGLAVTDPLGITAQGIETLQRKNKRSDFARLERLLREYQVREIVLGYPLRMSGEEGRQTEKVDAFRAELQARFNLPVHLWDERLTTLAAERMLVGAGVRRRARRGVVDQVAATLILQGFLDRQQAAARRDAP